MNKKIILTVVIIAIMIINICSYTFARPGDCGFEGGISSGYEEGKDTFKYSEVCFLSGKPIELQGTVTIKKTLRQGVIRSTYTYILSNSEEEATLRRVFTYDTEVTEIEGVQTTEKTEMARDPSEIIELDGTRFVLDEFDFSRSNIVDHRAAVDYYAGNVRGRKIYTIAGNARGTATVEISGDFYGYGQYWGSTEIGKYMHYIKYEGEGADADNWGGMAETSYSSSLSKIIEYQENLPELISFQGGHIEAQYNRTVLEYSAFLPEFDSSGNSTDNMIDKRGTLLQESYPVQTRLQVPSIHHLKGHWAENDIKRLYSLGVFEGGESMYNPEQIITRAEFTEAIVRAARAVPEDPELSQGTRAASRANGRRDREEVVSPFRDIPIDYVAFESIKEAYDRGLVTGVGGGLFLPDSTLTKAEALTIFIRALGLENMGPGQDAVTVFRDNDEIPDYARNAAYVAYKIGLVEGDTMGRLCPNQSLTKAQSAALLNRFIDYMREEMARDYRERVMGYTPD